MKSKQFTKQERHEIYKRALNSFNRLPFIGMCGALRIVSGRGGDDKIHKHFPEFHSFRPQQKFDYINKWFFESDEDMNERIKIRKIILQFCIEMTKP